jgi:surfeit locus 1 family protein
MRRFRPRLWPTLISLPAFGVLIGLGVWQLERLEWKTGLIAAREAALAAPAADLPAVLSPEWQFRRVKVRGRFLSQQGQRYGLRPRGGAPGYELLTPLLRAGGEAILVNRGWRPEAAPPTEGPAGEVALEGVLRFPRPPDAFAPEHDAEPERWLWYDLEGIERRLGFELAPAVLELEPPEGAGLVNNHLQYALTWFALAVALAAIYLVSQWDGRPERE